MDPVYREAICLRFLGRARRSTERSRSVTGSTRTVSRFSRSWTGTFQPQHNCAGVVRKAEPHRRRSTLVFDTEHLLSPRRGMPRRAAAVLSLCSRDRGSAGGARIAFCGAGEDSHSLILLI